MQDLTRIAEGRISRVTYIAPAQEGGSVSRRQPLVTGQIYHVFNRGIDHRPTFTNKFEYKRALATLDYYRHIYPEVSLSRYFNLEPTLQQQVMARREARTAGVEVLAYCLMPNHFHFLLRQVTEHGISEYLSQFQNSYTRYFNVRHGRTGALFLNRFKSVRIETETQLVHVSRYIHLNPYTGHVVTSPSELLKYPYSSLPSYINSQQHNRVLAHPVLSQFISGGQYQDFVLNQADYQRSLSVNQHILLEEQAI